MNICDKLRILNDRMYKVTPHINEGGCAVFAAIVAPYLNELTPTKIKVINDDTTTTIERARDLGLKRKDAQGWYMNGIEFCHVIMEFNDGGTKYFYDADGIYTHKHPYIRNRKNMKMYKGALSICETKSIARTATGWNRTFPRESIPRLRKIAKHFFENSIERLS
jgi:hypothetical protein